jgi:hypothetical protein
MVSTPSLDRGHVRAFFGAPFRLQTYRNLLYLGLALPLGFVYFVVFVVGIALGVGLSIVLVGLPILATMVVIGLLLAAVERRLATALLAREFDTRSTLPDGSTRDRILSFVTDLRTWTPVVYLPSKFVFGLLTLVVVVVSFSTGVSMFFMPLYYGDPGVYVGLLTDRPVELHPALYVGWNKLLVGFEAVVSFGFWRVRTLGQALAVALAGVGVCLIGLNLTNGLARVAGWFTERLLDGGYEATALLPSGSD